MAGQPYVYERQTEYWTSRQMEDFLLDEGFEVITYPLTQLSEAAIPADFLVFDRRRTKLIGFQHKALYRNGGDHWELDEDQHEELQKRPWIVYAASELRNPKEFKNALYRARFYVPGFQYQPQLPTVGERPYYRWGALFDAFRRCKVGQVVRDRHHLDVLLMPSAGRAPTRELRESIPDLFAADLERQRAIHFSPLLRP